MSVESVRKQILVNVGAERAFKVFTAGIDRWWPREHHIGKSPLKAIFLEERAGGRWYSVSQDGSECDIGTVLSWEPPHRLLLAWQITATWVFDPAFVTEVCVTFSAVGPHQTRVDMEHRNLERYGQAAAELRKAIDSPGGWGKIMEEFAKSAQGTD